MADIKDKLKQIKKERESRSKTQKIRDAWDKIDQEELSTKQKLEHLINLTRTEKKPKPQAAPFEPQEREPYRFIENPYPLDIRYGKIKISDGLNISGEMLTCLSKDTLFETLDLSTALFIDLETTGLSGGTGIIPFLVGLGYYRDDKFYVVQYFLGDPAAEERMVAELGQLFADMDFKSVVTFNGKVFDIPLLETRFILKRQPFVLSELPHLDFLFPARSLWGHKLENCRLFNLAREVVEADRSEDIPSAEIPLRYFQYIQTGNTELIEPILYHNQEDILSLLGAVVVGAKIFIEDPEACAADAMDFFGAGKIMERIGNTEKSAAYFQRAIDGNLSDDVFLSARKRLSQHFKKNLDWEKAVILWKEMASASMPSNNLLFSLRELAMYFEHKEKKYEEAKKVAEEGFVLARNFSTRYERDFSHRMDRLRHKIKSQKEKK
ncbi:MAG: ribonuclease H-like domain-containing protein [Candidatus Aminicenantes bacterium]